MKINLIAKVLITSMILLLALSACSLFNPETPGPKTGELETLTAGTVSARLTQIVMETLIAQSTAQALASPTPAATSTPVATATPLPPTATPIPPTATATLVPCYQATFITDVTIKDQAPLMAGETFVKTWRVKNTGACSWTKDHMIYFLNGNAMSAAASMAFPKIVNPGETVDLSVTMVAPGSTGDYSGNWMLKAPNGVKFGVGAGGNVPLSVAIKVITIPTPKDLNTVYDFVKNYCSAQWRTNAGNISCPSGGIDFKNGSITRSYAPVLENGYVDDEGAIQTVPAIGGDGMIQGQYPKMTLHTGDLFMSTLVCSEKMPKCSVTFELSYVETGSSTRTVLGTWDKVFDSSVLPVTVDLSSLDGKEVVFYLKVLSKGDSTNDFAQWMAAHISHP
jgi:hypothetical protein